MGKKLFTSTLALFVLIGCAKGPEVNAPFTEIGIELKNVAVALGVEKILSDRALMAKNLLKAESKSGWLELFGKGREAKMEPIGIPANVLLALVPKAAFTVTFEVTNHNNFDVIIGCVAFGLSEETIIFFPPKTTTAEVWMGLPAGETREFDIPMTLLKIPSLAVAAWPAIESGRAEWKARGTMIVMSEEIPSGGLRQRFETKKVRSQMVNASEEK